MDLDALADPEVINELQNRRCFIYPSGNKIIIKRKKEVRVINLELPRASE
jgi:hypothetical protein